MPRRNFYVKDSELDDFQVKIINKRTDNSFIVKGCAGSGKSILALWKAKQIQNESKGSYQIIVFTKALKQYMADGISQVGINSRNVDYLWHYQNRSGCPSSDYIIVDEAQDFSKEDILLFKSKAKKALLLYGDSAQQLYKFIQDKETISMEEMAVLTGFQTEQLVFNHRLPKKIARVAEYINSANDDLEGRCRNEGTEVPFVFEIPNFERQLDKIAEIIRNRHFEDVGILFRHNADVERAYNYLKSKGLTVEAKFGQTMDLNFGSDNPKILTYHSAKGLQFEAVFIPECSCSDEDSRNALYVAITRTYQSLYILHSGNLSSFFDDVPTNLYKNPIKPNRRVMIPPKLYLPTSTLNFNNIMSSESVSPATFYANRRFGYKRFDKVAPNSLVNLILLYGKYPVFSINDQGLENYPLVIEISTQSMPEDFFEEKDGIFYTSKTIYFNPFSTRIIFRTEEERTASLSKAEPSVESKLIPLYQGRLVVLPDDVETFEWHPTIINDLPIYDNYAISSDIAINKLKGMLYGYLLGANESSSKEIVALKRMVKDLRNVLSAVLTSPDGRATHFQQQQLDNLYAGINQAFYALSGAQSRINEVISQKIECYKAPTFVEILKGEGLYQEWFKKQVSQLSLRYYQITPFYLSYQPTDKVSELDRYIDNIERMIQTYDVKTKLDISKLPIIQNRRVVEVPEQKEFLPVLFNGYMDEVWNGTEFLSSRYEFAKVGGKLFREISGDNWENSPARTYINSLLKNLNEYTEFDINSTDSDILKSFAAFCQKGDSDIDKLRDYLISNGIGDFRIAFALWGLVFGFAEMPKTLTNELFEDQGDHYLSECYKSIYKQLHAIELQGTLERTLNREDKTNNVLQGVKKIGNMVADFFTGKSKGQTRDLERSREQVESNPIVLKIEGHPKYSKKKHGKFVDQIMEQNITNWDKIRKLSKGKDWMAIIDDLSIESPKTESVLFDEIEMHPIGQNFYIDKNVWYHIEPLIADSKTMKTIKGEIEWIQKAHQDGGYRKGNSWVDCKETDNKSVIHHFYYNAKKNGVEENTLNKVVEELKRLYHVQS